MASRCVGTVGEWTAASVIHSTLSQSAIEILQVVGKNFSQHLNNANRLLTVALKSITGVSLIAFTPVAPGTSSRAHVRCNRSTGSVLMTCTECVRCTRPRICTHLYIHNERKIMIMRAATVVQVLQDLLQLLVVAAIILCFIAGFILLALKDVNINVASDLPDVQRRQCTTL